MKDLEECPDHETVFAEEPDFCNEWYMCKDGQWYRFLQPNELIPPNGLYDWLNVPEGEKPDCMAGKWEHGYDMYAGALVEAGQNPRRVLCAKPDNPQVKPIVPVVLDGV